MRAARALASLTGCRILRALWVATALAGCGDEAGGDRVVDAELLPRLTLQEQLRIGNVDDPDLGFSRIGGISVDRDGRVYVLELVDRQVRVFDSEGARVRVVGRAGQGPGEFQSEDLRMGFVADTLWVNDRSSSRISLFRTDGELIRTIAFAPVIADAPEGFGISLYPGTLRDDGLISTSSRIYVPPAGAPPDYELQVPTVRLDQSGKVVDTIRLRPVRMGPPTRISIVDGVQIQLPPLPPSDPLLLEGPGSEHLFAVERPPATDPSDARFTVIKIAQRADTVFRKELRYQPRPFTDAFLGTLLAPSAARYAAAIRQGQPTADSATLASNAVFALRNNLALPAFAPPVSMARVDVDGTLWLRREDQGGPSFGWIVLRPDGEPMGQLDVPRDVTIQWSDGETVWASVQDELGVPWAVRYRLTARR